MIEQSLTASKLLVDEVMRIPYAMAKDGLMFKTFEKVSVNAVPINGVLFQGVWASVLALSGSFDTLTDYVIFGSWIFYGLTTSAVFIQGMFPV